MFSILRSAYGKSMEISKKNIVVCLLNSNKCKETVKNFMAPFYGWGSTVSRLEPLWGGSLLFTTKFPEISGTH